MVSAFQGILGVLWGHFLGGMQMWLGQPWKEFRDDRVIGCEREGLGLVASS